MLLVCTGVPEGFLLSSRLLVTFHVVRCSKQPLFRSKVARVMRLSYPWISTVEVVLLLTFLSFLSKYVALINMMSHKKPYG